VSPKNKQRALVIGLTILGFLFILFFGLRAFHAFRKFGGPPPPPRAHGEVETDVEQIRDWMTIPFISRMYGVSDDILFKAIGISREGNRKKNLKELNEEYFPEADGLVIELVKAAILAHQSQPLPDSPPMPDSPPVAPLPAAP
jgi:hypothetical protein